MVKFAFLPTKSSLVDKEGGVMSRDFPSIEGPGSAKGSSIAAPRTELLTEAGHQAMTETLQSQILAALQAQASIRAAKQLARRHWVSSAMSDQ